MRKRFWLVIRRYRGKERVLRMFHDESAAKTVYEAEAKELRDGDVELVECMGFTIAATSGGYNRTRW